MINGDYILVIAPEAYPGKKYRGKYVYEHRLVWWQHHGYVPKNDEVIHHINGNKHDNRIENLELQSIVEHIKHHSKDKKTTYLTLNCDWCGCEFSILPSKYRSKVKKGQKYFCCNRSHQVSLQHYNKKHSSVS